MNDVPNPSRADDAELLAAYLDAGLDDEAAAALEARLATDPQLTADLEAERELRELLGGAAAPAPPEGFASRLQERLDDERRPETPAAPVTSLAAQRQRRRPISWAAMGGVAATLVAVAVVGASVLTQGAQEEVAMDAAGDTDTAAGGEGSARDFLSDGTEEGGDMGTAAAESAPAPTAEADEEAASDDTTAFTTEDSELEGDASQAQMAMPPLEPVILSTGAVLPHEEAVRAHASDLPEVEGLLGVSGQEATDTAAAHRVAVQHAEPFPSGAHPAACLDTVAGGTEGTVAPVRVEEITYDGAPSMLYVLVVATGDSFDRVEGWVVARGSCATGLFVNLS